MGRLAVYLFKLIIYIAVISGMTSIIMLYPYYMEVKTAANMFALQFAHDGYMDKDLHDTLMSEFESENGILGNLTLGTNSKVDAGRDEHLLPSFTNLSPLLVQTYKVDKSGNNNGAMTPLTSVTAQAKINSAIENGNPPDGLEITNRDTPFVVMIRTNFKLQTVIMGRTYVAHMPITVTTTGITIKQYRW
ncbi:hypothetical protein ABGV42_01725 [Paenibacillus pabuli]|uniref:hypothetical protein n=1 Tax=Paenibacillus pabuli TaxID=1472 RepID=UPI0032420959